MSAFLISGALAAVLLALIWVGGATAADSSVPPWGTWGCSAVAGLLILDFEYQVRT